SPANGADEDILPHDIFIFTCKFLYRTITDVTGEFHLPPAILRLCIPLREDQIMRVRGVNLGDAPIIAYDFDFIRETRNTDGLFANNCALRFNDNLSIL